MAATNFPANPADIEGGRYTWPWHSMCAMLGTREAREQNIGGVCETIGASLRIILEGWEGMIYIPDLTWEGQLQLHLRFVWRLFFDAARFCDDLSGRDRLIVELMLIRGIGRVGLLHSRKPEGTEPPPPGAVVTAMTSDGVLFADMPWLVHDMTRYYTLRCATMSRGQRTNLHAFLATLGGIGFDDRLCGIGVMVLREAYETPREKGEPDAGDERDERNRPYQDPTMEDMQAGVAAGCDGEDVGSRTLESLTVADLVDGAVVWMTKAGDRFRVLAEAEFRDLPPEVGALGPLARDAGVVENGGFSAARVAFWERRRRELGRNPVRGDEARSRYMARDPQFPAPNNRWPDLY